MKKYAPVLLLALLLACAAAAMLHGGGRLYFGHPGSDLAAYFYPWRVFMTRWLERGVYPLWNPHIFGGCPVSEIQQMALFHPVSILTAVFFSAGAGLVTMMAANTVLAGALTYLGLRACFGVSRAGAVIGACVYVFGAVFSSRVAAGHFTVIAAMAWIPLAVMAAGAFSARLTPGLRIDDHIKDASFLRGPLCHLHGSPPDGVLADRTESFSLLSGNWRATLGRAAVESRPAWRWLCLAAVAGAMTVLAGAPQYVVYLFWAQIAAALVSARRGARAAALLGLACAWALAALISAPQWLPALSYLPYAARSGSSDGMTVGMTDRINMALEMAMPFPFGDDLRSPHMHMKNVWETCGYPGTLALLLTVGGLLAVRRCGFGRGGGARRARMALALIVLGFYLSWGGWLPGFGGFREPLKARVIIAVGIALGAAAGFSRLCAAARLARAMRRRGGSATGPLRPFLIFGSVMVVCAGGAALVALLKPEEIGRLVMQFGQPFDPAAQERHLALMNSPSLAAPRFAAAALAVAALAAIAVVLAAAALPAFGGNPRAVFWGRLLGIFALACLDPFTFHIHCYYSRNPFSALELPPALIGFFSPRIAEGRAAGLPPWRVTLPPVLANQSMLMPNLYETSGYDPLMPSGANNRIALHGVWRLKDPGLMARVISGAVGRRYHLYQWNPREPLTAAAASEPAPEASIAAIERNVMPGALPPDYFGPTIDGMNFVVPPRFAGRELDGERSSGLFRHRIQKIAEAGRAIAAETSPPRMIDAGDTVTMRSTFTPNRWDMDVRLTTMALAALRMTWLPGWRVSVDGGAAERPLCANHWMPAVTLDKGGRLVSFVYQPEHFLLSKILALLGCAAALVICVLSREKQRGHGRQ
ncbi:MAG: hypothetical protein WCK47_04995 [bacterium]